MWMWVSLPYATFGVGTVGHPAEGGDPLWNDWRVAEAAPIARWSVGKWAPDVVEYYRRKGAEIRGL